MPALRLMSFPHPRDPRFSRATPERLLRRVNDPDSDETILGLSVWAATMIAAKVVKTPFYDPARKTLISSLEAIVVAKEAKATKKRRQDLSSPAVSPQPGTGLDTAAVVPAKRARCDGEVVQPDFPDGKE